MFTSGQEELTVNTDREQLFTPVKLYMSSLTYLIIEDSLVIFAILIIGDSRFSEFDGIELQRRAVHVEHNLLTD